MPSLHPLNTSQSTPEKTLSIFVRFESDLNLLRDANLYETRGIKIQFSEIIDTAVINLMKAVEVLRR